MIDLNEMAHQCMINAKARIRNGARIDSDALKCCATEVVEAVEARSRTSLYDDYFSEELADIIICVLTEAEEYGIDIEDAIRRKVSKNTARAQKEGDKL